MHSPWKKDFPALNSRKISYLDSAATCQVPEQVISSINNYLRNGQGNAGRGMYGLSENANDIIKTCRDTVANLVACEPEQIIFSKSATESINLVASSLREKLTENDSILITEMEHHSNLLPWQRLCQRTGARLNVLPLNNNGELNCENLELFLQDNCKLFAFTHCSNVLGNHPLIEHLITKAKKMKVKTLIDGAQSISHTEINLKKMDCDFYAFSGHKLYSTGGSGVLFCKDINQLEPLILGGGSVKKTTLSQYQLHDNIARFEAGTANLVSLVGLTSSINYIQSIGYKKIIKFEKQLINYLTEKINNESNFEIISHPDSKSLVSFYSKQIHCHDVASILAQQNIAVRAGHHCAQPCLNAIGIKHCLRASIGLYNDFDDIDRLIEGLEKAEKVIN